MRNIIATWVCLDAVEDESYFPSAKGKSSNKRVQAIYWKCACIFFTTARRHNPDAELMLFSTVTVLPEIDGVHIGKVMEELKVQLHSVALNFKTPAGYYNQWKNQFYEFSIFQFISDDTRFDPSDRILLLDSDCVINRNLNALFDDISMYQCITYHIDYLPDHQVNGLSRRDMKYIFEDLLDKTINSCPVYHGGEIFASSVEVIRNLIGDFYSLWLQMLERHGRQQPRLNEEAHVLSFLFYKNNFSGGQANRYIKRLWTDPASFRNVIPEDKNLAIWHLPAEKRKGFRHFFNYLKQCEFNLSQQDEPALRRRLLTTFRISAIPIHRKPYYLGKRILKKLLAAK